MPPPGKMRSFNLKEQPLPHANYFTLQKWDKNCRFDFEGHSRALVYRMLNNGTDMPLGSPACGNCKNVDCTKAPKCFEYNGYDFGNCTYVRCSQSHA